MPNMNGFWSYVHKDDEADFGLISNLARDLVASYEAIRAEDIDLFLDSDRIQWGDEWKAKVDSSLADVAFVVPVLTPRYFKSPECRRELQFFLDRTKQLGIEQLVMPILYIDVPELESEGSTDPLILAVKQRQWRDWRQLRFEERGSGPYRAAVHALATEIAAHAAEAEQVVLSDEAVQATLDEHDSDGEPGLVDRIAALEESMPRWGETLQDISEAIQVIGDQMRRSTEKIKDAPKGKEFAARLVIARELAAELDEPVTKIEALSRSWLTDLDAIDSGVRVLVEQLGISKDVEPENAREFLRSLLTLSGAANQGLGSGVVMAETLGTISKQSRDLRPVVRRLQKALTSMAEARLLTDEWANLVDETQILGD